MFAQAPGFMAIVLGPDHVYKVVNQAYYQLVGHRNLLGLPIQQTWPDLEVQGYAALADRVYTSGQPFVGRQMPVKVQADPGGPICQRYVDFVFQPLFDAEGKTTGVFIQGQDVTEQKVAQDALAASNERWRFAIEGARAGVWDWNIAENELFVSSRYKEILGYAENDLIPGFDAWAQDLHPEDRQSVVDALQATVQGGVPYRSEFRIRCKNGDYKWVVSRAMVVARAEDGRPLRLTGTLTDISEQKEAEEEVWRQSRFDPLTGLPNRRLFRDRLEQSVQTAHREGTGFAVMLVDLDRFREVNDLHGHETGNQLLAQAAERLKSCVLHQGSVARLGSDEFLVIVNRVQGHLHAEDVGRNIITKLAAPFRVEGGLMHLSASIGITLYPEDASDPEELIRNADQAMYAAKHAGRNQLGFFTKTMQSLTQQRIQLTQDLRRAVASNELEVYYQPVLDMQSRKITKAEALLRWPHPELGFVGPAQFIPLAEESGLIHDIGNWVFSETASWSQRWRHKLSNPVQLSVNCSPVQILTQSGAEWLRLLQHRGVSPRDVAVEITEGVLLNASSRVTDVLRRYRTAGMQVALDDFGTGYSSLKYLMQFDLDYLKIDQSFVREIDCNEDSRAIVESIIAMAHRLGIKVIAEGIEKPEQEQILRAAGCEYGQGFLFSKAIPPQELEQLLTRQ
jgi:diguanylate cyclase (GGDEF)-like protein/PAS domain S-box-containing protein